MHKTPNPDNQVVSGTLYGVSAFLMWGLAPIFWKQLQGIDAVELLAHRTVWAVLLLLLMLIVQKKWSRFTALFTSFKTLLPILCSTLFLACNWFLFVYAILSNQILQTSLGYFINPLINVLLGFLFLRERLLTAQKWAVLIAFAGVLYMTVQGDNLPWIALGLGLTFGFYGLLRKVARVDPLPGLALETTILFIPAVVYLLIAEQNGSGSFGHQSPWLNVLLVGTGLITIVPLICFAMGVRRVSLSTMGLLQYLAPSTSFLLGIFVYRETFGGPHLVAFSCIWIALVIYSADGIRNQWRTRAIAIARAKDTRSTSGKGTGYTF